MPGPGPPRLDSALERDLGSALAREREDGRNIYRIVRHLLRRDGGAWHLVGVLEGGQEAVWQMAAYLGTAVVRSEISLSGRGDREVLARGEDALEEVVGGLDEGFAWVHPGYWDYLKNESI